MVPLLLADPVVIYPEAGVFLKHGREVMPSPDFVTLVCHVSPYRPQKLRKDFWEKLDAERPVFERLAAAAAKREDEVATCMVQEGRLVKDTVNAVTYPSGKRVRCGLPAEKAGVEATPISGGGSKREDGVVSCIVQEVTVGAVTHPSGKRVRSAPPCRGSRGRDHTHLC
ncbi:hypothetical protein SARC_13423, partial [Sphaeroforma arctica JP610]